MRSRAVAADRRVDRAACGRPGRPSTSARYSRRISRSRSASWSARCTSSDLATTSRPEVSRSRRWTMPGRHGSAPPAARPASAWASVPVGVARRRVHDHARRACRPRSGARPRRRPRTRRRRRPPCRARAARPASHLDPLAAREHVALRPRLAVHRHGAGVDQLLRRGARARPRGSAPSAHVEALAGDGVDGERLGHDRASARSPPASRRVPSTTYSEPEHPDARSRCRRC